VGKIGGRGTTVHLPFRRRSPQYHGPVPLCNFWPSIFHWPFLYFRFISLAPPPWIFRPIHRPFSPFCLFCFVSLVIRFVSRGAVSRIFVSFHGVSLAASVSVHTYVHMSLYLNMHSCVHFSDWRSKPPAITRKQPQKRQQLKRRLKTKL